MKHYAGLDVSVKETAICIVDENGLDLLGFCGERLAHFASVSLEGDWALEAER